MKFVQVIDGANNCVYDVFALSSEEHSVLFPDGTDIAFAEDFTSRDDPEEVSRILESMWRRRVPKTEARGIHGLLFYGLSHKRKYYPTLRDEEAVNPDGSRLRA